MSSQTMGRVEWLLLMVLSLLWGGSFFLVEVALMEWPPLSLVLARVSLAAFVLAGLTRLYGCPMPLSPNVWGQFMVMGILNNLIPFSLIVWGQTQITSGLAAILNATTPVFTVVLAQVITKDERLTSNRLMGVLLGVCGVVVLIGPNTIIGLTLTSFGQLAILGAACSYALAGLYGRRFKKLPAIVAATGMLTSTSLLLLPIVCVLEHPWTLRPQLVTWGAVAGLSILSTAIAYLLYFHILAIAGATNLLLVTFLIPISALLLGVLILGESLQWTELLGMAFVLTSLIMMDGRWVTR